MAVVNPNDLKVGDTIRFKVMNPHDNIVWTGKIKSVCDYDIARQYEDIDTIYQDVQREIRTLGAKETLSYLLLRVQENDTTISTRVFALDWIDKSTLELVEENTYTDFRVFDIDENKAEDLRKAITAMGYVVSIV